MYFRENLSVVSRLYGEAPHQLYIENKGVVDEAVDSEVGDQLTFHRSIGFDEVADADEFFRGDEELVQVIGERRVRLVIEENHVTPDVFVVVDVADALREDEASRPTT